LPPPLLKFEPLSALKFPPPTLPPKFALPPEALKFTLPLAAVKFELPFAPPRLLPKFEPPELPKVPEFAPEKPVCDEAASTWSKFAPKISSL